MREASTDHGGGKRRAFKTFAALSEKRKTAQSVDVGECGFLTQSPQFLTFASDLERCHKRAGGAVT